MALRNLLGALATWLTPKRPRVLFSLIGLFAIIFIIQDRIYPAITYYTNAERHPRLLRNVDCTARSDTSHGLSVNLVVASTTRDDISWTSNIAIPRLNVIRYIANSPSARYHPPVARGREALMYFTYLHDFYDTLSDISIFVHADETPWHLEGTLLQNTSFALSQLDLAQVKKREYFNLRVTWRAGCPAWINTTKTLDDWNILEEPYIRQAWVANFGDEVLVPEILAGPCCSQFAVTREAIHRRPKSQYKKSMDWLMDTKLDDQMSGRVWEHMWPWLFKNEAKDCNPELASLCDMYGLCFKDEVEVAEYKELWEERERLKEDMSFFRAILDAGRAGRARVKAFDNRKEIEYQLYDIWARRACASGEHIA